MIEGRPAYQSQSDLIARGRTARDLKPGLRRRRRQPLRTGTSTVPPAAGTAMIKGFTGVRGHEAFAPREQPTSEIS